MRKNILLVLFFFVGVVCTQAQMTGNDALHSEIDTVYKKILLVPYNPIMHVSDADHDIAEYSEKNVTELRTMFRLGLTEAVGAQLVKVYPTYSLISDASKETEKDLNMIYGSVNYSMDTVFPVAHPATKADSLKRKSVLSKKQLKKVKEIRELKFMNIGLSHPELLTLLSQKYGADLFVFLNQLEIKTNYDDCLDLALKIYRREIKVHYAVYDAFGKQLYGDVAVVDFPSNSNDIKQIMQANFLKIAEYIVQTIPKKKL